MGPFGVIRLSYGSGKGRATLAAAAAPGRYLHPDMSTDYDIFLACAFPSVFTLFCFPWTLALRRLALIVLSGLALLAAVVHEH